MTSGDIVFPIMQHSDCNSPLVDMRCPFNNTSMVAAQGEGLAAQRSYRERFLHRNHQDRWTFGRLHRVISTNGSFNASRLDTGIGRYCVIPAVEERILNRVEKNPSRSSRVLGTLHEDEMHPSHLQRVQAMPSDD